MSVHIGPVYRPDKENWNRPRSWRFSPPRGGATCHLSSSTSRYACRSYYGDHANHKWLQNCQWFFQATRVEPIILHTVDCMRTRCRSALQLPPITNFRRDEFSLKHHSIFEYLTWNVSSYTRSRRRYARWIDADFFGWNVLNSTSKRCMNPLHRGSCPVWARPIAESLHWVFRCTHQTVYSNALSERQH